MFLKKSFQILLLSLIYSCSVAMNVSPHGTHNLVIDNNKIVNLNVTSNKGIPFSVLLYTESGKLYKYAGVTAKHTGKISYLELHNLATSKNKITISVTDSEPEKSWLDIYLCVLSLIAFLIVNFSC